MNDIALFHISTKEDLAYQLDFDGLNLTGRSLEVEVIARSSKVTVATLTIGSGLTLAGTGRVNAYYAKGSMTGWARGEYTADLIDTTDEQRSRIVAVRVVYDEPGRLVGGVRGNQASVRWGNNQATVTATGGVGPIGQTGPANTLTIGDVETLETGEEATAEITGTAPNQALNLGLPKGNTGTAATIAAGTVTTGAPGTDAEVTNSGTSSAAVFDFTIPRGDVGEDGPQGEKGWAPELAVISDGERRVHQVVDWQGGEGSKPASGDYVGATGLVPDIEDAVDIRGASGAAVGPGAIGTTELADGAVTAPKLGTGSVETAKLAADAVTNDKLRDSSGLSVIGRAADTTGNPADIAAATDGHVLRRSGTSLGFGLITEAAIAASAFASQAEAEAGADDEKIVNALGVKQSIDVNAELGDFTPEGAGSTRTIKSKLKEWVSVDDYWEAGDPDDTASFTRALAEALRVELGAKTYSVSDTIALNVDGHALVGKGRGRTTITSNQAALPVITLLGGVPHYLVQGIHVTKSVASTAGGNGIHVVGTTEATEFLDLKISNCWNGMIVGTCDTGTIENLFVTNNYLHGIYHTNDPAYGPAQWEMRHILATTNNGDGIRVESSATYTGDNPGLILGTWSSIKTFANAGYGVSLIGNATTPIYDLRLNDGFLGADAAGCILLDTHGGKHSVLSTFIELVGRYPNGRNPGGGSLISAPLTGHGVTITANNADVMLQLAKNDENSECGILHNGGLLMVFSSFIQDNGFANVPGSTSGIVSNGGRLMVQGGHIGGLQTTYQDYGVASSHGDVMLDGVNLRGNVVAPTALTTTSETIVRGCWPTTVNDIAPNIVEILRFNSAHTPSVADLGGETIHVAGGLIKAGVAYNNP